ncbi:Rv3654c family TadE-like protein [Saccharopolyspora taberi]
MTSRRSLPGGNAMTSRRGMTRGTAVPQDSGTSGGRGTSGGSAVTGASARTGGGITGDRGAATVLAAALSGALITVLWVGIQLGSAVVNRHRAEGAADLAALAAAAHVPQGQEFACGRAGWVARGMGAEIASCRLDGSDARVELHVPGLFAVIDARARAGPVRGG